MSLPPIAFPHGMAPNPGRLRLGPGLDGAGLERLVGAVAGRRVLDLGCGTGGNTVTMALEGARVIGVEPVLERLATARQLAERHEVKVEFHHGDLADLAFVRADTVDVCTSIYALAAVDDLGRVFRQIHRVLRPDAPLVLTLPHPMAALVTPDPEGDGPPVLARRIGDHEPLSWTTAEDSGQVHVHSISEVMTSLSRANFRVDAIAEPMAAPGGDAPHGSPVDSWLPPTLVVRARKQGI